MIALSSFSRLWYNSSSGVVGGEETLRSFMSAPLKMMYSNSSVLAGTGRAVTLPSVPWDLTLARATVDSIVSTEYKMPSYLISAFEIKLILLPKYEVPISTKVVFGK